MSRRISLILGLILHVSGLLAGPLPPAAVPEPLKPWSDWAVWHDKTHPCPAWTGSPDRKPCAWPTALQLRLGEREGTFAFVIEMFAEQSVTLPGDGAYWPQTVQTGGKSLPVIAVDGLPAVWLPAGRHAITGRFVWDRLPSALSIPPGLALIDLAVNGAPVAFPALNEQGQLWLSGEATESRPVEAADTVKLSVFRQLLDGVPMQVITLVRLDISGKPRELTLQGPLPDTAIPMRLDSALPARVEPDGRLRLQARPGHWELRLTARYPADMTAITLPPHPAPWPVEEVWAFKADPAVRLAEVEGVPAVDPRLTELPGDWQALPAYRVTAGDTLGLRVIRRGDPQPEPDRLTLHRRIWLDFDGQGYTVNDRIAGQMTRDWRLNAGSGVLLGRVSIDGMPQPITRDEASGGTGVEVRRGALDLSSDSRLARQWTLPVTGWQKDFQSVRAELNLPPGWRLFSALGVDEASGAWLARWTLLDFFVVLTMTLAVGRLWDWRAGAFALITLALLWHEPGAPRYVWLNLLVATALSRVLPDDGAASPLATARARPWVRRYRQFALLALALVAIPFVAQQLRLGLYPQLEQPPPEYIQPTGRTLLQMEQESKSVADAALSESADALEAPTSGSSPMNRALRRSAAPVAAPPPPAAETDPNAITQTGPGLPNWEWQRLALLWKGPVQQSQTLTLILIPPAMSLVLNALRVILLIALAYLLIGGRRPGWRPGSGGHGGALGLTILLALLVPRTEAAEFPSQELLNELRARLLAPAECQPQCADIPNLKIATEPDSLRMELGIQVLAESGIPLPAQLGQWLPARVQLDGQPAHALIRAENGQLWLAAPTGQHRVTLTGPLPPREQIALPLPLRPHRVDATGTGWRVEGIGDHGVPDVQLRLIRELAAGKAAALPDLGEPRPLPPFLEVERTLRLGLEWRVSSVARRLTPADSPVALEIPLLTGESVLTADLPVRHGKVVLNLASGQSESRWDSTLAKTPRLTLTAPDSQAWTEVWRLDASPIWHVTAEGIAVVHHQSPAGRWEPEWRPWPGETVTLAVSRPAGAPGNTLTLDSSDLLLRPGERATESILSLTLRSSQGSQQKILLPPDATLQTVSLDGVAQPIRQEGPAVFLPVHPGQETVVLNWMRETGVTGWLRAPPVDLGAPSVNARTRVELSRDRWVLLVGGPRLGPAVLFWSLLGTLLLLSIGLARIPGSPLRVWQWGLLLVGLSQASLGGGLLVVGWLLALAWRGKAVLPLNDRHFHLLQIGLAALTLLALMILAGAVAGGLLGWPEMQIAGNGSDAYHLNWYQDRAAGVLPQPWALSVPLWVYRAVMLAWALWLANSVLDWLRWGWECYTAGGLWQRAKP